MNRFERVACNHILSDYPEDLSFKELKELILDESDQVLIYEKYEDDDPEEVIQAIELLANSIKEIFDEESIEKAAS